MTIVPLTTNHISIKSCELCKHNHWSKKGKPNPDYYQIQNYSNFLERLIVSPDIGLELFVSINELIRYPALWHLCMNVWSFMSCMLILYHMFFFYFNKCIHYMVIHMMYWNVFCYYSSRFVFIPGPEDPGPSTILPRQGF